MKTKILALSASVFVTLFCVSCGENGASKPLRSAEEVNTIDEEATEKGKAVAYDVKSKMTLANGLFREWTSSCNCFDDTLSVNESDGPVYEYKYNSDGLMLEYKKIEYDVTTVFTYDEHGEKLGEVNYASDGEKGYYARYENEYDEDGRIILQKQYERSAVSGEEEMTVLTEFKYDKDTLCSKSFTAGGENGKTTTVDYEYDKRGNIISETQTSEGSQMALKSTYNSRDLPLTQEMYINGELDTSYEYEYTFYDR